MCIFSSPKMPKMPEPPKLPQKEDASVTRDNTLRRIAGAKGFSSTILTAPLGAGTTVGKVASKSLLGG